MTPGHPSVRPGWVLPLLVAVLLLCVPALWNRQPLLYPDTPTYLRGAETGATRLVGPGRLKPWLEAQPVAPAGSPAVAGQGRQMKPLTSVEDKVVLAGRSVYYGALLYAGYLTSDLWLAVAVQALCVAYVLHLLLVRLWGVGRGRFVAVTAALVALTPLGVYTGLLMPDIFAPLVILSFGTLAVYWRQLGRTDRWALSLLLLFGLCAHASHLALAAAMLGVLVLGRLLSQRVRALPAAGLVVAAACVLGGVLGEWAFNKAVTASMGAPPLRLPHSMARLVDMGPGTDYLRTSCPGSGYAACAYLSHLPTAWDDFLFSDDAAKGVFALADGPTKRRMADEQGRFVVDVLRHDFPGVAQGVAVDVLRQLTHFGVDVWGYGERELAMFAGRVPERVYQGLQRSPPSPMNSWLTLTTQASVLASLVLALVWSLRRRTSHAHPAQPSGPAPDRAGSFTSFAAIVTAGVVCNAVLCATLASSLDRFQARVVWLLPLLALAVLAGATSTRPAMRHRRASAQATAHHLPESSTPPSSLQGAAS
ncbi:MAG: putative rane protein [Polaromonas sp.]|nr:putative rane protein [Polaromonas sp.]